MQHPPVTISITNYNGERFLKDCVTSIFELDYPSFDVMLVDNASTDGSVNYVREHFPQVKIHELPENRGANQARNFALLNARNRYLFLLDNDATLTKSCLSELIRTITSHPDTAICSPIIVYQDNPSIIQYGATHIHYIGQAIIQKSSAPATGSKPEVSLSTTANGTALLIDRNRANQVALFDEDMFFGFTDGDYTFRLTAAGLKCLIVMNSIVLHPLKQRSKSMVFHQVRNRWVFIIKNYSFRTLVCTLPALIFYEMMLLGFMVLKGNLKDYLKAFTNLIESLPSVLEKRNSFQKVKKLTDSQLLRSGNFVSSQQISMNRLQRTSVLIVNTLLDLNWALVRHFI
jgi:GT2 family glycosyltransferase